MPLPVSSPDRASLHRNVTVTVPLFQPFRLGEGSWEAEMVGGVRSMLMSLTVAEAELPALSVQVPAADLFIPSVVREVLPLAEARPASASLH